MKKTTIRQWLEDLGGVNRVDVSNLGHDDLELPAMPRFLSTPGTAALQVVCGGKVIVSVYQHEWTRKRIYLVVDDSIGETWDIERRRSALAAGLPGGVPRPSPRLRLVVSL